ncbi:3'(2'),5'-bisphosphate nucleotidase CysQ family protein [Afipia felis]|uniref:3'(2'),5'-bisphosphate nucleotidase CysQ n=2 Tax=Afipia felis TaxID=1035 RepID=A0A380WBJ8_AFIFE|nr:3'(2'),5'-bisphosphate nucleotidase CysQ [Afipia felis]EKS29246.1 3'(2'),5'-bisphosphate nucleotidase [Afipia felis ATCC 53690]SUU77954.1 3'(2'),5'-bisphosphate nucleotidase CysQ [Afipia felis]SUU86019.1 3'(2'),5'-bisphosphate nucleotidase CysQ [Afipia felis]
MAEGVTLAGENALTLMEPLTKLAVEAGAAILAINRKTMGLGRKIDGSVVSDADKLADAIIAEGLAKLAPAIPVLSEERTHLAARPYRDSFFLIDPLDGTREFITGTDEFTVNIALVTRGEPVLGIVVAPALGTVWRGIIGIGAERLPVTENATVYGAPTPIRTRPHPGPGAPWIVSVSRSHGDPRTEAFIAERPGAIRQVLGSAIKFCRVAEGGADIYPRLSPTSEWDVAAGHAIVTAAGGLVTSGLGELLKFGEDHEDFLVHDFIAWGDPQAACRNKAQTPGQ